MGMLEYLKRLSRYNPFADDMNATATNKSPNKTVSNTRTVTPAPIALQNRSDKE